MTTDKRRFDPLEKRADRTDPSLVRFLSGVTRHPHPHHRKLPPAFLGNFGEMPILPVGRQHHEEPLHQHCTYQTLLGLCTNLDSSYAGRTCPGFETEEKGCEFYELPGTLTF